MEDSGGTIAQQRLTYQHMFGACLAIGLLEDDKYVAIHCETIDDLLLEQPDEKFLCFQVTSKEIGLSAFKARDPKVLDTISNFCRLEVLHGADIVGYRFLASCGFLTDAAASQTLSRVIEQTCVIDGTDYASDAIVKSFYKGLKTRSDSAAVAKLRDVSGKLVLLQHPTIDGMYDYLYHAVGDALTEHDPSPACITRIVRRLTARVERAASKRFEGGNATYLAATLGRVAFDVQTRLHKRISKDEIRVLVDEELSLQLGEEPSSPKLVHDAFPKLRSKFTLNGGGETAIKSLQLNAFHALSEARARQVAQGKSPAERFDARVQAAALRLYTRVYSELESEGDVKAPRLYREIDSRVGAFLTERQVEFPTIGEEEFIGVIAVLTEDCVCWWGSRRDLEAIV